MNINPFVENIVCKKPIRDKLSTVIIKLQEILKDISINNINKANGPGFK